MPTQYGQSNSYLISPDSGGNYSDFGPITPGWFIGGLRVDNPTNNWWQVKETGDWIPPYTVNWSRDFRPPISTLTILLGSAATLFPVDASNLTVTAYEFQSSSPDFTVGSNNGISAPLTVQGTVIISGPVTISGSVTVAGVVSISGTVSISGPVTVSGSVTITSGTVDIGTVSGVVTITGTITNTVDVTVTNTVNVAVTNTISVSSVGGTVTVVGSVSVTGTVAISSGTVDIGTIAGTVTISGAVTIASGTVDIGTVAGTVTIAGSVTISGTPNVNIASGSVSITGSVTVGTITAGNVQITPGSFVSGGQGVTKVAVTGTAVVLKSTTTVKVIIIKARSANSGIIYLGKSTVTNNETAGTGGLQLDPGDMVTFAEVDTANIFINGTAGDGVSYMYWV